MAIRKLKTQPATLVGSPVAIYKDTETGEYVVKARGYPKADYFTDDKKDAESTAQYMRNHLLDKHETVSVRGKRNPVARKSVNKSGYVAVILRAPNDRNGNPRKIALIMESGSGNNNVIAADKHSYGEPELLKAYGIKSAAVAIDIPASEFIRWIRFLKSVSYIKYHESRA